MAIENVVMNSTDGPTISNTTTRTSCIPTANRIVLPNNFFYIGRALHFMMSGRLSTLVTAPGNIRLDICLGSAGSTIVFDTLDLALNIVAKTTVPWIFDCLLVCRAVGTGTATTFFPSAWIASEALVGASLPTVGSNTFLNVPVGTPAVGAGTDSTVASAIDAFAKFSVASASNSFTVHNYRIDVVN